VNAFRVLKIRNLIWAALVEFDIVTFVRTSYWNSMVYDIIPPAAMGLAFLIHDLLPGVVTRVTDANSGAGTAYISGAPEFTPGLYGLRGARS
jgi:hypothetical protein